MRNSGQFALYFSISIMFLAAVSCSRSDTAAPGATSSPDARASSVSQLDPNAPEDVRRCFESYRSALTQADGEAAAESVSSETIELYQEYRDLAASGEENAVKNLSMINRMQVLLLRHRIEPASLKAMDGKGVFIYAVNNQWIGKDGVVRAGLDDIAANGNRATARVTVGGKPSNERFHFVREDDQWKFDLVPTIKAADQGLQLTARRQGMSENDFLISVISSLSGRKVTEEIWQPLE